MNTKIQRYRNIYIFGLENYWDYSTETLNSSKWYFSYFQFLAIFGYFTKMVKNRNYKANFFILRQNTENSSANDESADSDPRRLRFESFIIHRWGDIR